MNTGGFLLKLYADADPTLLASAIALVYARRARDNEKPGSDRIVHSTRRHRPELVGEITRKWEQLADVDSEDDAFPFHESYVIQKWIAYRKENDGYKDSCLAAACEVAGENREDYRSDGNMAQ